MKFAKDQLQLYAITDRSWLKGRSLESVVEAALAGGLPCCSCVKRRFRMKKC